MMLYTIIIIMPLTISIVTPVYNGARFIRQTIESVLSQKGDFHIDYIIIDDGSTDNSLEIIKEYDRLIHGREWPIQCNGINFRYLTGPNKGQSHAYNTGFNMAKGELMAWMNADDYYLPNTFDYVAKFYEKDPSVDFIYGDCLKVYANGRPSTIEPRPRPDESLESLRSRGNSFDLCFFTKRIFDKVGPLDESLKYCLDLDFWFRIFSVGKVKYIPHTIAAFRIWDGSKTSTQQSKFAEERKFIFKKYGGNIIAPKKIYALRKRMSFLNQIQNKTPRLYSALKWFFYKVIDMFKYKNREEK